MGTGIGFKARAGDKVDESKINKIFRIENQTIAKQFQDLLANIPLEHMELTSDIISYAKKNLNLKLNQSIYVTLTDHINFAILRYRQGISIQNALLWEIKHFYQQEYLLGKYAVDLLNRRLNINFPEDEAGFIALHFVNAEYNTKISDTLEMVNIIQGILKIVKEDFRVQLDEESLHYERFVTHLKFLMQRLYRHEMLNDEEQEMARMMEGKYPKEYACSKRIAAFIEETRGKEEKISGEELMFLAIHIRRVCMQPGDEI